MSTRQNTTVKKQNLQANGLSRTWESVLLTPVTNWLGILAKTKPQIKTTEVIYLFLFIMIYLRHTRTDKSNLWSNLSFCLGFCANCLLVPWLGWLTSVCTTPTTSKNGIRDFGGVQAGLYPWWWLSEELRLSKVLTAILVMEAETTHESWNSPPKCSTKQIGTKGF